MRYLREPCEGLTPDRLYERKWATELLAEGFRILRSDYELGGEGRGVRWAEGVPGGDAGLSYTEVGEALGMAGGAVKVAVFRLRKRFGEVVRALVADTVENEEEQGEEILALFRAFDR